MQFENAVQSLGENVHYKACPFKANVLLLVCSDPLCVSSLVIVPLL